MPQHSVNTKMFLDHDTKTIINENNNIQHQQHILDPSTSRTTNATTVGET